MKRPRWRSSWLLPRLSLGPRSRVGPRGASAVAIALIALVLAPDAAPAAVTRSASAPTNALAGLPSVSSGHRPGPDILYANPPTVPQLENTGVWKAPPILVSGAQAYRDGEWLNQDYLFDDHGATGVPDLNTPYGASTNLFSPPGGTFTYPTDQKLYADNAADLVE